MTSQQLFHQAVGFHQRRNLAEAERLYSQILAVEPDNFAANHLLGIIRAQQGRNGEALAFIGHALQLKPDVPEALSNYGNVLKALGRFEEALASYDKALAIKPDYAEALRNRGNALRDMRRFEEAVASYDAALAIQPDYAEALSNRGVALSDLGHLEAALASYGAALTIHPHYAEALYNRGNVLRDLGRFEAAIDSYDKALAIKPDHAAALNNRGNALRHLKRFEEALGSYDAALAIKPDHAEVLANRGSALSYLERPAEALASFDKSLAIKPDIANILYDRGNALRHLKRFEDALASYDRALALDPSHLHALGGAAVAALNICDWSRTEEIAGEIRAQVTARASVIPPLALLGYHEDAALQRLCATNYIRDRIPVSPRPLWDGTPYRHEKIRIAYLSADFREHATAWLVAELFERHDRSRFDVLGVSFGSDDGSEMRARLVNSFDRFHDVQAQSDHDTAKLLHALEVDIAVDLKGHTQDSRPGILSYRPCPVQVNYLGYPGTMGADFIDYIIADRIVVPFDRQPFFAEKIVHLPDCYQVNDSRRAVAKEAPARATAGLPERSFVFCCFNNSWKLTAPLFEVWMRLLDTIPGSVLWLIEDNGEASAHLRAGAAKRGIDPQRLIFAARANLKEHLARHRLANLFLDTLPYNAHTTASDALWAGLPIITCLGECFAGRVAASLLHAIGLPELATRDLEEYEDLARKLARDPSLLHSLRDKLKRNRLTYPLFDTERFRRHIESAYTTMREIAERGQAPRSFNVA